MSSLMFVCPVVFDQLTEVKKERNPCFIAGVGNLWPRGPDCPPHDHNRKFGGARKKGGITAWQHMRMRAVMLKNEIHSESLEKEIDRHTLKRGTATCINKYVMLC